MIRAYARGLTAAAISVLAVFSAGCSSDGSENAGPSAGTGGGDGKGGGSATQGGKPGSAGQATGGAGNAGGSTSGGGRPAGWLYTEGNKILKSDGQGSGTPWMGRGVNTDDIFFCGYNNSLWMPSPGTELKNIVEAVMSDWKPSFFRISLGMASYPKVVSWTDNVDDYQKPMLEGIRAMGAHPGVYVLVVVRSDASMIGHFEGGAEPTGIPSDSQTTPDKAKFPNGTDDVYKALVNTFKDDAFVMFGLTNEPGGNGLPNEQIHAAMDHAVGTIRAEEDRLGVPHHIVAVQGQAWTGDISYYADHALEHDNVVYEVHGYPPPTNAYTYANLPVIIGEYGHIEGAAAQAFFADVEAKGVPNLAWDLAPYSDCAPDLVEVNHSSTNLVPSAWGKIVQAYLLEHAD